MKTVQDIKALVRDLDARSTELRKQVEDIQRKAAKTISERPLLALGVAFAVGMAFGVALSRSKD